MQALSSASQAGAWLFLTLHLLIRPPQTPSFSLVVLLLALVVCAFVDVLSYVPLLTNGIGNRNASVVSHATLSAANAAICVYASSLCLRMPVTAGGYEAVVDMDERLRHQVDANKSTPPADSDLASVYRSCPTSPEDYCTLYENLSYSWMAPIQKLALSRSLKPTDVWRLRAINDTRLLFRNFKALERPSGPDTQKPRLLSRILRANANDIALDAFFKLISVSFAYLGTFILKSILDQIQIAAMDPKSDAPNGASTTMTRHNGRHVRKPSSLPSSVSASLSSASSPNCKIITTHVRSAFASDPHWSCRCSRKHSRGATLVVRPSRRRRLPLLTTANRLRQQRHREMSHLVTLFRQHIIRQILRIVGTMQQILTNLLTSTNIFVQILTQHKLQHKLTLTSRNFDPIARGRICSEYAISGKWLPSTRSGLAARLRQRNRPKCRRKI